MQSFGIEHVYIVHKSRKSGSKRNAVKMVFAVVLSRRIKFFLLLAEFIEDALVFARQIGGDGVSQIQHIAAVYEIVVIYALGEEYFACNRTPVLQKRITEIGCCVYNNLHAHFVVYLVIRILSFETGGDFIEPLRFVPAVIRTYKKLCFRIVVFFSFAAADQRARYRKRQ